MLESFIESGLECAKLHDWEGRDAHTVASNLNSSTKRFGLRVKAMVRNSEIYLLHVEMEGKV